MQDCLASLQSIPIIKSLCVLNKDYLRQCATQLLIKLFKGFVTHSSTTPDLNPVIWGHLGVCLPTCRYVCLCAKAFVKCVTVTGDILKREPQKRASFYFTFLCPSFQFRLGHLSHVQPSRLLRATEENRKRRNKAAREELGRQGRLSNWQAGCPTWSRNCECDRYRADVDDWCTSAHTNSEPLLSLLPDYHNSLIYVSTYASERNVLHQHCAAGPCLSLSLWLHYGT